MRIGDSARELLLPGRRNVKGGNSSQKTGESSGLSSSGNSGSANGSTEVSELMARLKDVPGVRDEVVTEVGQRLKKGELMTPEAAYDTAKRILSALASYDD